MRFSFINSYLGEMEPVISRHGGIVDKYIGDAEQTASHSNVRTAGASARAPHSRQPRRAGCIMNFVQK